MSGEITARRVAADVVVIRAPFLYGGKYFLRDALAADLRDQLSVALSMPTPVEIEPIRAGGTD